MSESHTSPGHRPDSTKPQTHTDIHLPRRRHNSPWSNRMLIVFALIVALILAPLWLDPTLFAQLLGMPTAAPTPATTPASSMVPYPSVSGWVMDTEAYLRVVPHAS